MDGYNLVSFAGIFVLMAFAWALSTDRRRLNLRCIAFGVGLQMLLGLVVFWAPGSTRFFLRLNDAVVKLFTAASAGQKFLFGKLGDPAGSEPTGFVLAFGALPVIIFYALLQRWFMRGLTEGAVKF